jgi:hypothetical protein
MGKTRFVRFLKFEKFMRLLKFKRFNKFNEFKRLGGVLDIGAGFLTGVMEELIGLKSNPAPC